MATENTVQQVARRRIRPISNILENKDAVVLSLEMPGVRREDLDINVENDQLIITGRRAERDDGSRYVVRERPHGEYFRSFAIDDTIDREKIDAKLENGVLNLTLHIKESQKPRKIAISAK